MNCDEIRDEYGAYALGIAEQPELFEIAEHCSRSCPNCVPGVRDALRVVAAMAGAVKLVDPPRSLRRRVIAMVSPGAERSRWPVWLPWAAVATMAVILASVVLPARNSRGDAARLEQALSILNDPVTKDVTFGAPAARGRVFANRTGVLLIAAHMPNIAANQTFELWVIPPGANPRPAGTFQAQQDSTAVFIHNGPVESGATIAVTVEPAGGSPQPTSTPFIATKL